MWREEFPEANSLGNAVVVIVFLHLNGYNIFCVWMIKSEFILH